jgi:hypothetical protein
MTINYYKTSIYGRDFQIISDPKYASIFQEITGMKTLPIEKMEGFKKLGFEFVQVLR